jgi:hypothetical protein
MIDLLLQDSDKVNDIKQKYELIRYKICYIFRSKFSKTTMKSEKVTQISLNSAYKHNATCNLVR